MGLFTAIYSWFMEYFFAGIDTLPAIVQGIAPELCTLVSLFASAAVIAVPMFIMFTCCRWVFSFGGILR